MPAVDCQSAKLGFMAVFGVDSSSLQEQTTPAQSTPTVSTEPVTPEQQVHIQIKLVGNYGDFITESSKSEFISKVTQALADAMGVPTSRITNVDARAGSIQVSFTLKPGGPGENNVSTAALALRELVTSGNFSVTLADGRTLVADALSFQSSATPFTPSPSQTFASTTEHGPTETSSKLSTGALIGIIVGSLLAVVFVIAVAVFIVNKRSKFSKVDESSQEDLNKPAFLSQSGNYDYKNLL